MGKLVEWQQKIASLMSQASEASRCIINCMDASANSENALKVEGLVVGFMYQCEELRLRASATWLNPVLELVNWPRRRKWFNDLHSYFENLPAEILSGQQIRLDAYHMLGRLMSDLRSIQTRLGASVPKQKATDTKKQARDKWIYSECMKGTKYTTIAKRLSDHASAKGWRPVTTQRIPMIAKEYAARDGLETPPARQDK